VRIHNKKYFLNKKKMEIKEIKDLFLRFLNKFENEKDLFKFFNYLQLLLIDFETDFSKFKGIFNKLNQKYC
jgi:hypothetical protein